MVQVDLVEANIDGRTFWARPVNLDVLQANNVVVAARAESMCKPLPRAVGFFFGNFELSIELWTVIAGISGFDNQGRLSYSLHILLDDGTPSVSGEGRRFCRNCGVVLRDNASFCSS